MWLMFANGNENDLPEATSVFETRRESGSACLAQQPCQHCFAIRTSPPDRAIVEIWRSSQPSQGCGASAGGFRLGFEAAEWDVAWRSAERVIASDAGRDAKPQVAVVELAQVGRWRVRAGGHPSNAVEKLEVVLLGRPL